MKLFEHRHWWRAKDAVPVVPEGKCRAKSVMRLEECSCGAVRTIEYASGQAPVIRMAADQEFIDALIERDNKIALLRSVLGRLVNDSMYKDHPEASQMALDALKRTE